MDRAEGAAMAALREEVAALRRQVEANDRELVRLLVNLAGEVEQNRARICEGAGETPAPLVDGPAHAFIRFFTDRPLDVSC